MSDTIDWIARAGTRAKGRRPDYFDEPAIDRMLSITLAIMGEVAVLRERMDTIERLLDAKGTISRADIDRFTPTAVEAEERGVLTKAYIARVMRGMQQDLEAMEHPDPPVEEWVKTLSVP